MPIRSREDDDLLALEWVCFQLFDHLCWLTGAAFTFSSAVGRHETVDRNIFFYWLLPGLDFDGQVARHFSSDGGWNFGRKVGNLVLQVVQWKRTMLHVIFSASSIARRTSLRN